MNDWGEFENEESFYASIKGYREIAETVGCSATEVGKAFDALEAPELYSRSQILEFDRLVEILDKAIPASEKLSSAIGQLAPLHVETNGETVAGPTNIHQIMIEKAAGLKFEQVERLLKALKDYRHDFGETKSRLPRIGRTSEPAVALIHEGLANLFNGLGKPITFGHMEGEPTTDFGRAVSTAFRAFGLKTDWRRSTQDWCRKHKGE